MPKNSLVFVLSLAAAFCLVGCAGGGSGNGSGSPDATAAPATTSTVAGSSASFEAKDIGSIVRVTNLTVGPAGLKADVSIENTGEYGDLTLELNSSRALLLNSQQADAWKTGYPRAIRKRI